MDYHQTDWIKYLKIAQFSYNNTVHSSHGHTPFFASEGRHPYSGLNPRAKATVPAATAYIDQLVKVHEEVKAALDRSKAEMKEVYDRHRQDAVDYQESDLVWLEGTNLKSLRPSQALNERRYGPFKILEKIGASAYRLEIPDAWKVHNVFNEALLTPYHAPVFENQEDAPPPPAEMVGDHEEHVVEAVVNSKVVGFGRRKSMLYLVKWKGYPDSDATWEPRSNLGNAAEAVQQYHHANPQNTGPNNVKKPVPKRTKHRIRFVALRTKEL